MMNHKREINDLKLEIDNLKHEINNPVIGKGYISRCEIFGGTRRRWYGFAESDITDRIDDKIKIFGIWENVSDCVFYNEFKTETLKIENKYKPKEE